MVGDVGPRFFERIQAVWAEYSRRYRIIPFCTPVFQRPNALVIGTNHSDFVDGGGAIADQIADRLAAEVPDESTFLVHDHKFAKGLQEVCRRASIDLDATWMGTNRCPIQTGPDGIDEIVTTPGFSQCQVQMDRVLRELITEITPRNVILVGKYAIRLFYAGAAKATFRELKPRDVKVGGDGQFTRLIPIPHPSRATFWEPAAETLAQHYIR